MACSVLSEALCVSATLLATCGEASNERGRTISSLAMTGERTRGEINRRHTREKTGERKKCTLKSTMKKNDSSSRPKKRKSKDAHTESGEGLELG